MRHFLRHCAFVLPLGLMLAGCQSASFEPATSSTTQGSSPYVHGDLGTLTYRAVDLILADAPQISMQTPLVVATISDARDMETSSELGNIVADMIRTRVAQNGYAASEFRLRNAVNFGKNEGEFMLSRNARALMPAPSAAAILTGTYAVGFNRVYVSLKLISATDSHILSGADFVLPIREVEGLMLPKKT
jgi:hypothetical protein